MRLCAVVIMVFITSVASAATHPRVLINSTIKTQLEAKAAANTTEWQALKAWCDTELGANNGAGYQGEEWYKAVTNYGMCFQATGDQDYGNEGVIYLKALLRDKNNIGDGLGGATAIQTDSGWVARTFGSGVAIGRDWLDGATDLTGAIITECGNRLDDWITWYGTSGYGRSTPEDNYHAGYFAMVMFAGYSLEDDATDAATWRTQAETMWDDNIVPLLNGGLDGGDWAEGWNYGPWAVREYLQYPQLIYTATGSTAKWSDTNYNTDLLYGMIHMLHPSRGYVSDDGSWSGSYKGNPNPTNATYLIAAGNLSAEQKSLAKWYATNLAWNPYPPHKWEAFLWADSTVSAVTPTASNMNGLSLLMAGTGRVLARSADWSNVDATFVDFSANTSPPNDIAEGEMNAGEFKISSRGELLIVDSDTWEYTSNFGNVMLVEGSHTYEPNQEWWRIVETSNYDDGGDYVYAKVTGLETAYDGNNGSSPSLSSYRREMLFLRPDITIIVDTVVPTSQATNTIKSQVNFMGDPALFGQEATVVNGNAKVWMTIVGHSVSLAKTDKSSTRTGVYLVTATPSSTAAAYKLMHVIETADSSKSTKDTITEIDEGLFKGVLVEATNEDYVALFSDSAIATLDPSTITYSIGSAGKPTRHIISNLTSGDKFDIEMAGDAVTLTQTVDGDYTVNSDGVLLIETAYTHSLGTVLLGQ